MSNTSLAQLTNKRDMLMHKKFQSLDFSSVEAFLELSFSPFEGELQIQSPKPHFLSALANTLSIESGDFSKYSVKEQTPGIFSLSLPALDFLNDAEVSCTSLLLSASEDVGEQYFETAEIPTLERWGNNLISLEKSLVDLGLTDRHSRGLCIDAEWEGLGLLLLENTKSNFTFSNAPRAF